MGFGAHQDERRDGRRESMVGRERKEDERGKTLKKARQQPVRTSEKEVMRREV